MPLATKYLKRCDFLFGRQSCNAFIAIKCCCFYVPAVTRLLFEDDVCTALLLSVLQFNFFIPKLNRRYTQRCSSSLSICPIVCVARSGGWMMKNIYIYWLVWAFRHSVRPTNRVVFLCIIVDTGSFGICTSDLLDVPSVCLSACPSATCFWIPVSCVFLISPKTARSLPLPLLLL